MKYTYQEYEINGIGDHNSVSNGPDNGANNCIAGRFWNCMRHGSTAHAVSNYLGRLKVMDGSSNDFEGYTKEDAEILKGAGNLNIGGHGNEGLLETGVGQNGSFDINKYILTWNQSNWGPELQKLRPKNFTMMSIYSCHSGAGADGARLLWMMANALQRAVRGRTGFTYCGSKGITFEKGSVWQVATPGPTMPNPIPAPTPHLWEEADMHIRLIKDTKSTEVPYSDVISIDVERNHQIVRTTNTKTLSGTDAEDFAKLIFGSEPFSADAQVMGFVTAKISITFQGEKNPRKLVIYNDRLVEDTSTKVFYYAMPGLKEFLSTI
ncbi:hypothetical protein [Agarivorans sp. Alg241-V36]|uniref:hypothetical protein n=1 Tax=Agarivorans sp. Alg241-V36 TaxID=2305992 RepID=UPI0013D6381E|nr:hypothetical protein [Agarivorans sp. Alg241-V36]